MEGLGVLAARGLIPEITTCLRTDRSYVWAKVTRADGAASEAWLETVAGYAFTAVAGVRAAERLLEKRPVGALTPSRALGADFVIELPDTTRFDELPACKDLESPPPPRRRHRSDTCRRARSLVRTEGRRMRRFKSPRQGSSGRRGLCLSCRSS